MPEQNFYRTVPALASYIDRIGAVEKNFRRWLVQENHGHYYREKCVIKCAADGTVTVSDAAYAPTEAEQAAICLAFAAGIELPRSTEMRPAGLQDLMEMLRAEHRALATDENGDPAFFVFISQVTGNIQMVQQRIDTPDGKRYLPWSYWSDGMWRRMEPDTELPFWKPAKTDLVKVMVHEGAKAAQFVTAICNDPNSTHPWAEDFRKYEHWGMIGGALSPHRANYQELWDRNFELMVYVCDNDWPGKEALPVVSKKYRRALRGIYFDSTWPPHWDMADPMPANKFSATGRYKGARLEELFRNCTWATDEIAPPAGSKGRPTLVINRHFAEEWHHIRTPEVFVHESTPRQFLDEKAFNGWVNPYSNTDDTAKILRRKDVQKATSLRYIPHQKGGLIKNAQDEMYFNTHEGPIIKPEQGDCRLWEAYLEHTFPKLIDRNEVIRWCATLVCHPEVKMNYGMLLISENQGVGKSTLGSDIMKPLMGDWNCSEPSETTVVDQTFNSWCAHKRLAIIHEIYAGHSSKAYDRLKSVISEATLTVNEKYQKEYAIENWLHILAASNSKRALKLSMDDRRWFVPTVTENKRHPGEWAALHKWLSEDGGLNKIKWWFANWLASNGGPVERGVDAPPSSAKQEVVIEGYSPGQMLIHNLLERLREESDGGANVYAFPDVELQRVVKDHIYEGRNNDRLERASTLRKVAKNAGWHVGDIALRTQAWPIVRGQRAYVVSNDPLVADMGPTSLLERFPQPLDVSAKARQFFGAM